jgi:transposase
MKVWLNGSLETAMKLYCGIDLHANNHYICVIDEKDKRLLEVKCDNDIALTIKSLSKYKRRLQGIAVESTFNWYWLVDGKASHGNDSSTILVLIRCRHLCVVQRAW